MGSTGSWLKVKDLSGRWGMTETEVVREIAFGYRVTPYILFDEVPMELSCSRGSTLFSVTHTPSKNWVFKTTDVEKLEQEIPGLRKKGRQKKSRKIYGWITADDLKKRWGISEIEMKHIVRSHNLPRFYEHYDEAFGIIALNELKAKSYSDYISAEQSPKSWIFKLTHIEKIEQQFVDLKVEKKATEPESRPKTNEEITTFGVEEGALNAKERRELGQLRKEKLKWDDSILGAVCAALFCQKQKRPVTRKELWSELREKKYGHIPDSTFDKIWNAIPAQYRHKGGRPKNPQKHS